MKTKKMKLALFVLCGILFTPHMSAAYEVTETTAQHVTDDVVMFSITYKFGFLNRDMRMPIIVSESETQTDNITNVAISALGEAIPTANLNAIVLSNDEDITIEDGQYYLSEGNNAEFTLLAFVTLAPDTPRNALQLSITHLPYTMIDGDNETVGAVLNNELPDYRTPFLTLLDEVTISASPVVETSWK